MKVRTSLAVLAIALLSGVSAALAAESNTASKGTTKLVTHSTSDTLSLTSKQQAVTWRNIAKQARKEEMPTNFTAKVGAVVPSTMMTYPVPMTTSRKVPLLRRYQYALLENNKLLIINPNDKRVADVITR